MKYWQGDFNSDLNTETTEESIDWTFTETFNDEFKTEFNSQAASRVANIDGATLWNQLRSGTIPSDQIDALVARFETIPVTSIPVKKRLEMVYELSSPPAFPKPKVAVQDLFLTGQVLRWVVSVLPEGCAIECYDDFRWNSLPPQTIQRLSVDARREVLDSTQTHHAVVQVWLEGAFSQIGITLPNWYIQGKTCDDILCDLRLIFGPSYRKEILSNSSDLISA